MNNPSAVQEDGTIILHGESLSNILAQALFLQYREGDRESMDREMLYCIIDILLNEVDNK